LKLSRDVSGEGLVPRQTGSHIRVTSNFKGKEHHVTIPAHKQLRVGTLAEILTDVSTYLDLTHEKVIQNLFG
jgi:hypothetical protein